VANYSREPFIDLVNNYNQCSYQDFMYDLQREGLEFCNKIRGDVTIQPNTETMGIFDVYVINLEVNN
jgi:hypothetical protein